GALARPAEAEAGDGDSELGSADVLVEPVELFADDAGHDAALLHQLVDSRRTYLDESVLRGDEKAVEEDGQRGNGEKQSRGHRCRGRADRAADERSVFLSPWFRGDYSSIIPKEVGFLSSPPVELELELELVVELGVSGASSSSTGVSPPTRNLRRG